MIYILERVMDYRSARKYGRVSLFTPFKFSTCKFNCDLLSEHCQYYSSLLSKFQRVLVV